MTSTSKKMTTRDCMCGDDWGCLVTKRFTRSGGLVSSVILALLPGPFGVIFDIHVTKLPSRFITLRPEWSYRSEVLNDLMFFIAKSYAAKWRVFVGLASR